MNFLQSISSNFPKKKRKFSTPNSLALYEVYYGPAQRNKTFYIAREYYTLASTLFEYGTLASSLHEYCTLASALQEYYAVASTLYEYYTLASTL